MKQTTQFSLEGESPTLSNIWNSIHEKVKQHWRWVEKKVLLIKKACKARARGKF